MQKLSAREKIMIYVMILVIIMGAGFMALKPVIKNYRTASEDYEASDMLMFQTQQDVASYGMIMQMLKQEMDKAVAAADDFPAPVTNDELERIVLRYVENAGLLPEITSINSAKEVTTSYVPDGQTATDTDAEPAEESEVDEAYDEYDMNSGEVSDSVEEEPESMASGSYVTGSIYVTASGTFDQLISLLNACKNDELIRVSSFSMYDEENAPYVFSDGVTRVFYISFEYYTMKLPTGAVFDSILQ